MIVPIPGLEPRISRARYLLDTIQHTLDRQVSDSSSSSGVGSIFCSLTKMHNNLKVCLNLQKPKH